MRSVFQLVLLLELGGLGACSGGPPPEPEETTEITSIIASRVSSPTFTVAFTTPEMAAEMPALLSGQSPQGFRWVRLTVEGDQVAKVADEGISVDLSQPGNALTFSQSYKESCNPLRDDHSVCWFSESYAAGVVGLSGHVTLRVDQTTAVADIDVTWEGYTDRYKNGRDYYYKHGTLTGFSAPLIENAAIGGQP
jgi:hypothetical protein